MKKLLFLALSINIAILIVVVLVIAIRIVKQPLKPLPQNDYALEYWQGEILTIGDVYLHWGDPSGYGHDSTIVDIWWGSTEIDVDMSTFSPFSKILYFTYNDPEKPPQKWQGFKTR